MIGEESSTVASLQSQERAHDAVELVRKFGLAVFALQLAALLVWSEHFVSRFSLTTDYAIYHQAWWLIGHGHFNPFDSINGIPFWTSHGETLMWLLAPLGLVFPHDITLLWVQDFSMVGAELVAFTWLIDFARLSKSNRRESSFPALLSGTGLLLLVANPWIYWSLAFDFHLEIVGVLFISLLSRDLYRGEKSWRIWLWVALSLACGDVVATYALGVGLTGLVSGRGWRRRGLFIVAVSGIWVVLLSLIGANQGSSLSSYSYLTAGAGVTTGSQLGLLQLVKGLVVHPVRLFNVLWSRRLDLYASVAASGLVGLVSPWVLVPVILVLLENGLNQYLGFIVPSFQDALIFILLPVGTVSVLAALSKRHSRSAVVGALVIAINVLLWGAIWIPRVDSTWIRVSPSASAALLSFDNQIPRSDEVIASQGIVGRFSDRQWIYDLAPQTSIPIHTSPVWFVVAPGQGNETLASNVSDALITQLAGPRRARLVSHEAGVWLFRWVPREGISSVTIPSRTAQLPAWTSTGEAGQADTSGAVLNWHAAGISQSGYVVSGDYWRELQGSYRAVVNLSSTMNLNVEVWNATGNVLLARQELVPTHGRVSLRFPFVVTRLYPQLAFGGVGPFSLLPIEPLPGNQIEIRVWSPGGGDVKIYSMAVQASKS
jgi:uncharacterized membrane protein